LLQAADKLALAELEREVVDSLVHTTQFSSSCLRGTAGGSAAHQQHQPQVQQQQQQPQTPHGHHQQLLLQTPHTAARLVGAASQGGSGSQHGLQQQLSGQRAPLPVSSGHQQSQGNTPLPQHHQQAAAVTQDMPLNGLAPQRQQLQAPPVSTTKQQQPHGGGPQQLPSEPAQHHQQQQQLALLPLQQNMGPTPCQDAVAMQHPAVAVRQELTTLLQQAVSGSPAQQLAFQEVLRQAAAQQQQAAAASPGSLTSGSQDKTQQDQQLQQGLVLRTAPLPASQPTRPQDLILQGQQMLQQHAQHPQMPGKRKEPPIQQQHDDREVLVRTHSLSGSLCKKQRSCGEATPQHCFGTGPSGADVQQQQQQPNGFDVTRFSVLPAQLMMQKGRAAASIHQPPALCGPITSSASLLVALQSAAAAAAAAGPEDQQQHLPPLDSQRQQELLQHGPTQRWSSAVVDLEPELLGAVRGAPLGASSPTRLGSAPTACLEDAAGACLDPAVTEGDTVLQHFLAAPAQTQAVDTGLYQA